MKKCLVLTTVLLSSLAHAQIKVEASLSIDGVERIQETKFLDNQNNVNFAVSDDATCDLILTELSENQFVVAAQITAKNVEGKMVVIAAPVLVVAENQHGMVTCATGEGEDNGKNYSLSVRVINE